MRHPAGNPTAVFGLRAAEMAAWAVAPGKSRRELPSRRRSFLTGSGQEQPRQIWGRQCLLSLAELGDGAIVSSWLPSSASLGGPRLAVGPHSSAVSPCRPRGLHGLTTPTCVCGDPDGHLSVNVGHTGPSPAGPPGPLPIRTELGREEACRVLPGGCASLSLLAPPRWPPAPPAPRPLPLCSSAWTPPSCGPATSLRVSDTAHGHFCALLARKWAPLALRRLDTQQCRQHLLGMGSQSQNRRLQGPGSLWARPRSVRPSTRPPGWLQTQVRQLPQAQSLLLSGASVPRSLKRVPPRLSTQLAHGQLRPSHPRVRVPRRDLSGNCCGLAGREMV
ncbi:uncharacterized protein LOC123621772 [Lemur catta]|uniref:uncharacterized protein LOC123621772 n=1 Tax=Lemur catta TaxID=9447 RepID=UPI001E2687B7|nr:uncharacterized protein LOC123621772 [Lemur catta]XP_045383647.1 uncharacterized protein LOC123621772 [Lemur catta]